VGCFVCGDEASDSGTTNLVTYFIVAAVCVLGVTTLPNPKSCCYSTDFRFVFKKLLSGVL
jgi:hypothetical protein